jgi:hypothetical protein
VAGGTARHSVEPGKSLTELPAWRPASTPHMFSKIKPFIITGVVALVAIVVYRQIQARVSFLPAI